MNSVTFFNLFRNFLLAGPLDPVQVVLSLNFGHQWVNKVSLLNLSKIVVEDGFNHETFPVLEFASALHHTIFPISNVDVAVILI